ncbi:MAG: Na/Pi cotransporter family protein [Oscillospiraceae bacterium]|nr:Na/Pi cotransporter family protein [Oscillospiraceae bacterium]MDY6209316.1 Na/Pi cotransporter family protein [Oscillospiraceae bacterium]
MTIFNVIHLFGGLAMFLYGMNLMSDKLEKLAGGKLEQIFEKLTSNRFKGLLLGILVTAVVQSSSATTVMLVGFVNSGLMRLSQAISIIMGANIGTTVTTWILSLTGLEGDSLFIQFCKPKNFAPLFALVGVVMRMASKDGKKKDIGGILIGFGLLMWGMVTMGESVEPLSESEKFTSLMTLFKNPVLGVLVGAVVTAVIQSSAASVGMLQTLSNSGLITFGAALPIILGQNIGTCVTAIISSAGANKSAKRVAAVHLYFNIIGTVLALVCYYTLDAFIHFTFADMEVTSVSIAIVHTVFNIGTTLVLLPFTHILEKLAYLTIRDEKKEPAENLVLLDDRFLNTPGVAIEQCRNVTNRMASLAKTTISLALDLYKNFDEDKAQMILENEDMIDKYEDITGTYLVKLSGRSLTMDDSRTVSCLLHSIGDFERISDHAVNILDTAREIHTKEVSFSTMAKRELNVMFGAIEEILDITVKAFESKDIDLAYKVEPLEEVVDYLRTEMKSRHVERLRTKTCTIEQGFIFTDLLTDLERISDHCSNIAVNLIQINDNSFENHRYLNAVKSEDNEKFAELFKEFSYKYPLPKTSEK